MMGVAAAMAKAVLERSRQEKILWEGWIVGKMSHTKNKYIDEQVDVRIEYPDSVTLNTEHVKVYIGDIYRNIRVTLPPHNNAGMALVKVGDWHINLDGRVTLACEDDAVIGNPRLVLTTIKRKVFKFFPWDGKLDGQQLYQDRDGDMLKVFPTGAPPTEPIYVRVEEEI